MKSKLWIVIAVITITLYSFVEGQTVESGNKKRVANEKHNSDLLNYIVTRNTDSWEKLTTVSYTFDHTYEFTNLDHSQKDDPSKKGPVKGNGTGKIIKSGNFRWSSIQDSKTWTDSGASFSRSGKAVINDNYVAAWHGSTRIAEQFDHLSRDRMSPKAKSLYSIGGAQDVLLYGFGNSINTLKTIVSSYKERGGKWTVEKQETLENKPVFLLKGYASSQDNHQTEFTIDPEKGFLVSHKVDFHNDSIYREIDVSIIKNKQYDAWYPQHIEIQRYKMGSYGKLEKTQIITIRDLELVRYIPAEQFTFYALGLDKDTWLIRHTLAGSKITYKGMP